MNTKHLIVGLVLGSLLVPVPVSAYCAYSDTACQREEQREQVRVFREQERDLQRQFEEREREIRQERANRRLQDAVEDLRRELHNGRR